jgi:hypothetical protein
MWVTLCQEVVILSPTLTHSLAFGWPILLTFCLYLFIYGLFTDSVTISEYTASNNRVTVNTEFGRVWKEMNGAYFEAESRHFPGRTEENHIRCSVRKLDIPDKIQSGHLVLGLIS